MLKKPVVCTKKLFIRENVQWQNKIVAGKLIEDDTQALCSSPVYQWLVPHKNKRLRFITDKINIKRLTVETDFNTNLQNENTKHRVDPTIYTIQGFIHT